MTSEERERLIKEIQRKVLDNQAGVMETIEEMERYLTRLYQRVGKDIVSLILELNARMPSWTYIEASKYARLVTLLDQINEILNDLRAEEVSYVRQELEDIYEERYLRTIFLLGQYTAVTRSFDRIPKKFVKESVNYPWSGAMFSDRIWDNKELLLKNLREGITQSLVLGESMQKAADRINKGINNSRFNALRVARTEVMRVSYVAEAKAMADNGIKRVQYLATTSDERTCEICGETHLKIFQLGKEVMLPRHPMCRCTYVPILDPISYNDVNARTRAIRDADDYPSWRDAQ